MFCHRGLAVEFALLPRVDPVGDVVDVRPAVVDLGGQVGEPVSDGLETGDLVPELFTLAGVANRVLQ